MPAPVEVDDRLGPEAAEHLDLLLRAPSAVPEVLAERLELDVVPAQADSEPEPPAREQVDLGGLLGDEGGLALGQDEHPCDELESGRDPGEVPEEDEELVELVLGRVRPWPVRPLRDVRAEDVVIREEVVVADLLGRLRERPDAARVGADLGLREDDAQAHTRMIHH